MSWRSVVGIAAFFAAQGALASEEAQGHAAHGVPWGTLLLSAINLSIFVWLLGRFVMPAVRSWVSERRDQVINDLKEAAAAKDEAARLKAEWEARLATLERTTTELRAQAQRDAEQERERILAAARAAADAIRKDAERAAAYELRRMQQQLRAELVRQAVHLAEESTRAQWTAADQQRFIADFLKQVRQ
ncbi:MAG TPA: ATP synthase F0 subunit B [Candidatus Margulisiibacteriota bacterium]|nr:ATP synthase F0 subunit B [Candidatus Margulisiibacteriota bacterium]